MTDQTPGVPSEELFEGEATGLEIEDASEGAGSHTPWDPNKIRVTTKTFSLRNVLDMIDEKSLELAPDFQRNRVWKARQKSRLVESILLQIPLPAFYFAEDADSMMRVVDGLQRLSTIKDFVRGEDRERFALTDLEYLHDEQGKVFAELLPALQRRLHNTQIVVHVIAPTTSPEVTYNIFKRINTGGTPLNAQEIRHCMSRSRSRDFLRRCAETEEFVAATQGSLRANVRMGDREVVLRFCAFRLRSVADYKQADSIDSFLLKATRQIDDPHQVNDIQLADLEASFRRAMRNAQIVFGEHAFRKWEWGQQGRNPINRALFETWSVALADLTESDVTPRAEAIRSAARDLMTDSYYFSAITTATGDPRKVEYRMQKTIEAAQAR
ncbi:hypothetical protein LUPAC06_05591 [Micromonospora saelicesensis]|uniref:DUF262 domain-containing protein n=1 Tax=Micromonospora saelicesensis TaxID=285676 RepID=UPI000DBF6E8C|nr:DUF262 domain-containing protein [Micromonospora saelicesensis]RAO52730.1 hypothetical protein LUPAC06_05591 [Micromonospora saelicesensis]